MEIAQADHTPRVKWRPSGSETLMAMRSFAVAVHVPLTRAWVFATRVSEWRALLTSDYPRAPTHDTGGKPAPGTKSLYPSPWWKFEAPPARYGGGHLEKATRGCQWGGISESPAWRCEGKSLPARGPCTGPPVASFAHGSLCSVWVCGTGSAISRPPVAKRTRTLMVVPALIGTCTRVESRGTTAIEPTHRRRVADTRQRAPRAAT